MKESATTLALSGRRFRAAALAVALGPFACRAADWTWDEAGLDRATQTLVAETQEPDALASAQETVIAHVGVCATHPLLRPVVASRLCRVLASPAPVASRRFACRELSRAGAPDSVPAIAPLLADPELADIARYALQVIRGPEAAAALRAATSTLNGRPLAGVLDSLGERREAESLPVLVPFVSNTNAIVSAAAIRAVGRIGGPDAAAFLMTLTNREPAAVRDASIDARLECADHLLAANNDPLAARLIEQLRREPLPRRAGPALFRGLFLTTATDRAQRAIEAFGSEDDAVCAVAGWFAASLATEAELQPLADAVTNLPPRAKSVLLLALANRNYTGARRHAVHLLRDADPAVRASAIRALGAIGDAQTLPILAETAGSPEGYEQSLASVSLSRLRGAGIETEMASLIPRSAPPARRALIRALAARRAAGAAPALLDLARTGGEPPLRIEALNALGALLPPDRASELVDLLAAAASNDVQRAASEALRRAYLAADDAGKARIATAVVLGRDKASAQARALLVALLPVMSTPQALNVLRAELTADDEALRDAAVRALAAWPNRNAADDLLAVAQRDASEKRRTLALQGFLGLIQSGRGGTPEQRLDMCRKAKPLATRTEELRLLLSCLGGIPHPGAMDMAASCLPEKAVQREACGAILRAAQTLRPDQTAAAAPALRALIQAAPDARQREQAIDILKRSGEWTGEGTPRLQPDAGAGR